MSDIDLRKRPPSGTSGQSQQDGDSLSLQSDSSGLNLKRSFGLAGGISFIVGSMIGSGIFVSPKGVLDGAGSVGLSLVMWAVGGVLAMFGAISYVELGTMIPLSGGEYSYLIESVHPVFAFLFAFVSTFMLRPSIAAIICLTCAQYVLVPLFDDGCGPPPYTLLKLLALTVIFIIAALNIMSAKKASQIQVFFTIAKLLALVVIIIGGFVKLIQGNTEYLENGFEGTNSNAGQIAIGLYSSMFAYDGWNNLNYVTEELQEPQKNLPRAIFVGIPLVIVLYVLTNISYFTVLSPEALLASPAVAVSWAELVIENIAWVMPIFVAMSTFGAANGMMFTSGRLAYVAARGNHMVKILSFVHVTRFTPSTAIMLTATVSAMMALSSSIGGLLNFFSFAAWMFYGLVFGVLIYLRFKRPDAPRPYKVPLVFPIVAILMAIFLVLAPIIQAPQIEFLYAFLFILSGLILYFPFVHFKKEIPGMEKVNATLQMFFQVAPSGETGNNYTKTDDVKNINKVQPVDGIEELEMETPEGRKSKTEFTGHI